MADKKNQQKASFCTPKTTVNQDTKKTGAAKKTTASSTKKLNSTVCKPQSETKSRSACTPKTNVNQENKKPSTAKKTASLHSRNPNATLLESSSVNRTLAVSQPEVEWDLECDFAYGKYLRTLMKKKLIAEQYNKVKLSINDQLSIQGEILSKLKQKKTLMEQQLELVKLQEQLNKILEELQTNIDTFNDIAITCKLENRFDEIINVLQSTNDKLHLKNVKLLEKHDLKKLSELLEECATNLPDINKIVGCEEQLQQVTDTFNKTLTTKDAIVNNDMKVSETVCTIGNKALKKMSDHLAIASK